ncbi:hypothetical protein [Tsukamurella tyrosinosolvens]|uniref:hypothetical protein n=1 Tax=Tsukamurella tyrosinosolvens TaxID=57704 RepID=UPI000DF68429|nr:hypothetical protein [Tsukamurella tyrosinosolvens]
MRKSQYDKASSWPLVRTVATLNAAGFDAGEVNVDVVRLTARRLDGLRMPYAILDRGTADTKVLVGVLVDVFSRSPHVIDPVLVCGGGVAGAFAEADLAAVLSEAPSPAARRNEHAGLAKFLLAGLLTSRPAGWSGTETIETTEGLVSGWCGLAQRFAEQTENEGVTT